MYVILDNWEMDKPEIVVNIRINNVNKRIF